MKRRRNRSLELAGISHRSKIILEAEDEDLFGDDEADDAEEKDTEDKDAAEDEDAEEPAAEEEAEEEQTPDEEKLPAKDIAKFGPGEIDSEIDSILKNIYDQSAQSAAVKSATSISYPGAVEMEDEVKSESNKYSMKHMLLEEPENTAHNSAEFNLDFFTSEVARYINNYQSLLDMEGMLFNKARQFLLNQFGVEMESDFVERLATSYSLDFDNRFTDVEDPPVATGGNSEAAPS